MKSFYFLVFTIVLPCFLNFAFADLPDDETRKEIETQILEIAVSGIDNRFADAYDKIMQRGDDYEDNLKNACVLIWTFRKASVDAGWSGRQSLNFKIPAPVPEDYDLYDVLMNEGKLHDIVMESRPLTPSYVDYRNELLKNLYSEEIKSERYPYVLIKQGASGPSVSALRKVLVLIGFLDKSMQYGEDYDTNLEVAIKKFQEANGIKPDGIVGRQSYDQLFKNEKDMAVSLARTIIRLDDSRLSDMDNYIFVNIPDMMLHLYQNGESILDSKVVVGAVKHQTPRLDSEINNVIFNPPWIVPASIKNKDIIPGILRNRGYLAAKGLKLYYNGSEIDPSSVSNDVIKSGLHGFRVIQAPSKRNALGLYKFNIPNSNSVYLHSTNVPSKFNNSERALSHGCVRVEKSAELAKILLEGAYSETRLDKILASGKTAWLHPNVAVHLFISYLTAFIGQKGHFYYYPDVYELDNNAKIPDKVMKYFNKKNK